MRKKIQGSMTIEAAVVVPLILWMFALIILLLFYFHDKNVVTVLAHETVSVCFDEKEVSESVVEEYFQKRLSGKLLLFSSVKVNATISKKEIIMTCHTQKSGMKLRVEVQMKKTEPETYIRNLRRIKNMKTMIGEEP